MEAAENESDTEKLKTLYKEVKTAKISNNDKEKILAKLKKRGVEVPEEASV